MKVLEFKEVVTNIIEIDDVILSDYLDNVDDEGDIDYNDFINFVYSHYDISNLTIDTDISFEGINNEILINTINT